MNELYILEKYKLTPTELFTIKCILIAKEDGDYEPLQRLSTILDGGLRLVLERLQIKGIILKSFKIPKVGSKLEIEDIPINQNFQKQYFRASFKMGEELFETYPQSCYINNQYFNLRSVSHKFDSLEEAFAKYSKYIKHNPEKHQEIIELIEWGKENNYNFTTLDRFIVDNAWESIKNMKENNTININSESIKLI